MIRWEYALLVRRRVASIDEPGWEITFAWYGPDGTALDVTNQADTALAHLNTAGRQGWELASVTEEYQPNGATDIYRYHLKRPVPAPPVVPPPRGAQRRSSVRRG